MFVTDDADHRLVDPDRNIEHRRQTIYRVVECIVQRQREFLDKGVEYIKPMMLKDVAEDIGMHLSTISRVVNRKYAHTPQGVIELRRFFSEGMMNEEGEEVSTRILKLRIKKMVEEEDSKKPMTDEQIEAVFAPELGDESLLRALVVNTTWPAWSVLRDDLGLDVAEDDSVASLQRSPRRAPGSRDGAHLWVVLGGTF